MCLHNVHDGVVNWYQNKAFGEPPIYSLDHFLTLFRLVVVSWRRSGCVKNGDNNLARY